MSKANDALFDLVSASLKIANETYISEQGSIVKTFLSFVIIENCQIHHISLVDNGIKIVASELTLVNTTIGTVESDPSLQTQE